MAGEIFPQPLTGRKGTLYYKKVRVFFMNDLMTTKVKQAKRTTPNAKTISAFAESVGITPAAVSEIAAKIEEGFPICQLSLDYGVSDAIIRKVCSLHGVKPSQVRRRLIAEAVHGGKTIADVAERFSVTPRTVRDACVIHHVKVPEGPQFSVNNYEIIADLIAGELTLQEIGNKFGVKRQRIWTIKEACKSAGVFTAVKEAGKVA